MDNNSPISISKLVTYQEHSIVRHVLMKNKNGAVTIFAFDQGQALPKHTSSSDALVQVLEGSVEIFLGDRWNLLRSGDGLLMPAQEPHAVRATEQFKMLLTTIKPSV